MPIAQSRISTVSITEPRIHALVESILRQQNTAVLGTCFMEIPRCSQVPFAVSEDLRTIVIITAQNTAKYENMAANPNVSLLVAAPAAEEVTLQALTVTAFAAKPKGARKSQAMALFIRKHQELRTTASSPDTALVELKVDSYGLIADFQEKTCVSLG